MTPVPDEAALEELRPANVGLELVESLVCGVVGAVAVAELRVTAVIDLAVEGVEESVCKFGAGVLVL